MVKTLGLIFLLALAGCAGASQYQYAATPCSTDPGGYACQVDQYMKAP